MSTLAIEVHNNRVMAVRAATAARADTDKARDATAREAATAALRQGWSEPFGEGQQYGYGRGGQYGEMSRGSEYGSSQYGYGSSGQGIHRGKGPKNFQRSDDRIKELICERLTDDPDVDASEVTLNVQGGKITLEGTVDSRQTKMKIEDIADQFGSHEVQNNLRVQKQSGGRTSPSATGGAGKSTPPIEEGEQSKQKRN